jgi:hypothetical protein
MPRVKLRLTLAMFCGLIIALGLALLGCPHEEPPPPVAPPPEDLSTWTVPELVQPPKPETPALSSAESKSTAAEKCALPGRFAISPERFAVWPQKAKKWHMARLLGVLHKP